MNIWTRHFKTSIVHNIIMWILTFNDPQCFQLHKALVNAQLLRGFDKPLQWELREFNNKHWGYVHMFICRAIKQVCCGGVHTFRVPCIKNPCKDVFFHEGTLWDCSFTPPPSEESASEHDGISARLSWSVVTTEQLMIRPPESSSGNMWLSSLGSTVSWKSAPCGLSREPTTLPPSPLKGGQESRALWEPGSTYRHTTVLILYAVLQG